MKTKATKKRRTPVTASVFPRMADLDRITLGHGGHRPPGAKTPKELCVMEAFAFVRGINHTDHPPCVSDKIGSFMRSWNDSIPDTPEGRATRDRLLKPLIPLMVDTATGPADDLRRSYMALDWVVRVHLPAWLDLSAKCRPAATKLRALPELTDPGTLALASPLIQVASDDARAARAAAWAAAWDAAWDAARAAAWDAAWDAARAAAWDAAWAAAWDAAWDAARAAAWDAAGAAAGAAARDAAWDAAWDAARAAAGEVFAPTVATLQESAQDLVRRMCAVGKAKP